MFFIETDRQHKQYLTPQTRELNYWLLIIIDI